MSRIDSHEFEYPPGLGFLPNNNTGDRGHMSGYQYGANSPSFSPPDRRPPMSMQGYPMFTGSTPRSIAMREREYGFGIGEMVPNRHTPAGSNSQIPVSPFSSFHHHHTSPPLPPPPSSALYHSSLCNDRDAHLFRHAHNSPPNPLPSPANPITSRSTLWWGELEPWMDEEFTKQVCSLMGWDPVTVKVPHPAPDPNTGQQPNNPGYCFLTFPTAAHAASVLAQINNNGNGPPVTMPNSTKPFNLSWASSVPSTTPLASSFPPGSSIMPNTQQQYPKEYSIFVGDLAPETSNSDLVAVFRNPVLGLRNDREPKFIRPFVSCKSAKIMLDPVTGVSRGYGFVRFTDESDQQRALIEMHGLYCLSRPMRISPATAKFKPQPTIPALDLPQVQFPSSMNGNGFDHQSQPVTIALPLPTSSQTKSVSAPIAAATSSNSSLSSNSISAPGSLPSLGGSNSTNSISSGTGSSTSISSSSFESATSEDMMNLPNDVLAQIAQQYANGGPSPVKVNGGMDFVTPFVQESQQGQNPGQGEGMAPRYTISEESWKHHAQARAILGNLIGPNGEQLTSTDPYNTTVFVGGLSPLISEETLRTFFAPFGDIHYVKVPVGKHCGFVQFVRKADAERAIEKMQGFPVGGSRIRLSWGRSQYKAAQAAAQAAQAAALQTNFTLVPPTGNAMTQEQVLQLLQSFTMKGYLDNSAAPGSDGSASDNATIGGQLVNETSAGQNTDEKLRSAHIASRDDGPRSFEGYSAAGSSGRLTAKLASLELRQNLSQPMSNFSPFSPDPNLYGAENKRREPPSFSRVDMLPHPSKAYAPGFLPAQTQDLKANNGNSSVRRVSPTSTRPPSASRYGSLLDGSTPAFQINRAPGRPEAPISRPSSGRTSTPGHGEHEGQEYGVMQDLNGTLASLDLDRPWKSPTESSESSSGSVQFRMTMGPTPSP